MEIYGCHGCDGGGFCPQAGGSEVYGDETVCQCQFQLGVGEIALRTD